MLQKSKTLRNLQTLVKEMRDLMFDHAQEEAQRAKAFTNTIKAKSTAIATLTKRSEKKNNEMRDWKIKFNALKDELAAQKDTSDCMSDEIAVLSDEIDQWYDITGEMQEHYEEAIHSLTPETFGKHWVKNIGKKGTVFE